MTIPYDILQLVLSVALSILAPYVVVLIKRAQHVPLPIAEDNCSDALEMVNELQRFLTEILYSDRVAIEDIRAFAFFIGVDLDSLQGTTKRELAIDLLRLVRRKKKIIALYGAILRLRDDLDKL